MSGYPLPPARRAGVPALAPASELQLDFAAIPLRDYVDRILGHRGLVAAITLSVAALGAVYAFVRAPVYEGNMLFAVEQQREREPVSLLGGAAATFDRKPSAIAEVELLRSRRIVGSALDALQLDVEAAPQRFPVIGAALARRAVRLLPPGIAGYGGYCWGAEAITLGHLQVPPGWLEQAFTLTAQAGGRYRLGWGDGSQGADGQVGQALRLALAGGELNLMVSRLDARPGARFVLRRHARQSTLEGIQRALTVAEVGKESGIISVAYRGADADAVYRLLAQLAAAYLRQNQQRKADDVAQTLQRFEQQLPALKRSLERAEADYNSYRNSHATVDLAEETRSGVQRGAAAAQQLAELQQRRAELRSRVGDNHPQMLAVEAQLRARQSEMGAIAARQGALPMIEQELGRRAREVKVNSELYSALLRTWQELHLVSLDSTGDIRLVDAPVVPVRPSESRPLLVAVAAMLGLMLGIAAAFLRGMLAGRSVD